MISAILDILATLALVGVTVWLNLRTTKENRKLFQYCVEASKMSFLYERRLVRIETTDPTGYHCKTEGDKVNVYAEYDTTDTVLLALFKSYPFDPSDPEGRDFARRNAEELVEILKRESI